MRTLPLVLFLSAAWLAAGCGGDDAAGSGGGATSGAGGSGGSGGAGGAATGTGGAATGTGGAATGAGGAATGTGGAATGTGGAGGGGPACVWGDDCGQGMYCDAPGCGAGACAPRPNPATLPSDVDAVCGCDGNTYWNEPVAAWMGVATQAAGACPNAAPCGPNLPCPGALKCRRVAQDAAACDPNLTGTCWGTPLTCALDGPKGRACSDDSCQLVCSLVQSQNPWYADLTCP